MSDLSSVNIYLSMVNNETLSKKNDFFNENLSKIHNITQVEYGKGKIRNIWKPSKSNIDE